MVRIWIVAVTAAVGLIFSAGCGQAAGEASSDLDPPRSSDSGKRPPDSTLSYDGKTVTGALGGYCWIDLCTDTDPPVPDEREALAVPSGAVLVFDYSGEEPPSKVWPGHSPLVREKIGTPTDPLPARREGEQTEIPAALPAGEYLINVFVRIPEGDASYYFRVVVEPGAGTLPNSGGPGDH